MSILIVLIVVANNLFGQDSGEKTKYNINFKGCILTSLTVKWNISSLMGEPVVNGSFKWQAGSGTDKDCLNYKDFIILKCQSNSNTNSYAWVKISPTVPNAGAGFGFNTSGSPSWDNMFCSYNGIGQVSECWSAIDAKKFWKSGFSVVDFKILREE